MDGQECLGGRDAAGRLAAKEEEGARGVVVADGGIPERGRGGALDEVGDVEPLEGGDGHVGGDGDDEGGEDGDDGDEHGGHGGDGGTAVLGSTERSGGAGSCEDRVGRRRC